MSIATHIAIAATEGPKAGLNAYMSSISKSGLASVKAQKNALMALGGGSKGNKARFDWYCARFGADIDAAKASAVSHEQRVDAFQAAAEAAQSQLGVQVFEDETPDPVQGLMAQIEALQAQVLALTTPATPAKAEPKPRKATTRKATTKAAKKDADEPTMWREWAIRKFNIPMTVGSTFVYAGKRRKTTFQVVGVTKEGVLAKRVG